MQYDVVTMISHLAVHFGRPKSPGNDADYEQFYQEYLRSVVRSLKVFAPEVLQAAVENIIATRKYRNFPGVADIRDACVAADKVLRASRPQLKFGATAGKDHELPEWHHGRDDLADELIMTELGRRAAREQWISSLHQFCSKNMRLPEGAEIKGCIDAAKRFDGGYQMALRGECGAQSHALVALGTSMLAKREALRARVLDGVI